MKRKCAMVLFALAGTTIASGSVTTLSPGLSGTVFIGNDDIPSAPIGALGFSVASIRPATTSAATGILIGAPLADATPNNPAVNDEGAAYFVALGEGVSGGIFYLDDLDGTNGYGILGKNDAELFGYAVADGGMSWDDIVAPEEPEFATDSSLHISSLTAGLSDWIELGGGCFTGYTNYHTTGAVFVSRNQLLNSGGASQALLTRPDLLNTDDGFSILANHNHEAYFGYSLGGYGSLTTSRSDLSVLISSPFSFTSVSSAYVAQAVAIRESAPTNNPCNALQYTDTTQSYWWTITPDDSTLSTLRFATVARYIPTVTAGAAPEILLIAPDATSRFLDSSGVGDPKCVSENDYGNAHIISAGALTSIPSSGIDLDTELFCGQDDEQTDAEIVSFVGDFTNRFTLDSDGNGIGDFNDDGKNDFAIGLPAADSGDGRVFAIWGQTNLGPGGTLSNNIQLASIGSYGIQIDGAGGLFGAAIAGGDFNDDGISDLVIGAPEYGSNRGRVYIIYGDSSPSSVIDIADVVSGTVPGAVFEGWNTGDYFGTAIDVIDYNSDGVDDIVVGARGSKSWNDSGADRHGAVWVLLGELASPDITSPGGGWTEIIREFAAEGGAAMDQVVDRLRNALQNANN